MPSLYEATATVGDVSSSNFTTLYNASGLTVPNAGAGSVSGNLNVSGNLTVQGTSLLVGAVTVGSTLSTPNYTFPLPDGTTDQVMTTDGNGNLYWTSIGTLGGNYTIQADTTTGGGNLTLVSSLGATDSVKFASGTGISVARTDANTITISNTSTGTTYNIDASTTTGGANFNLVGSDATTDTVKFAAGSNMTITRTDANTITFDATGGSTLPSGTLQGQLLYWDGSAWTADVVIGAATAGARLVTSYLNSTAGVNSAFFLRKNYGATAYSEANGDGVAMSYTLDSDSQPVSSFGLTSFTYSTTDPTFGVLSSTNNFSSSTTLLGLNKASASLYAPELILNATQTGTPTLNAIINANRGSSTDATITWNESTDQWEFNQNVYTTGTLGALGDFAINTNKFTVTAGNGNTSVGGTLNSIGNFSVNTNKMTVNATTGNTAVLGDFAVNTNKFTVNSVTGATNVLGDLAVNTNKFNAFASTGNVTAAGTLSVAGASLGANSASAAVDSFVYLKGTTQYLKWNNTSSEFELSDPLSISNTAVPGAFERQVTAASVSPTELKTAIKLTERVTDAGSNATDDGGPAVMFSRTSGASGGTEKLFANMGAVYYGTTNTADMTFNWSSDNFFESSPGVFPNTYTMLRLGSSNANFLNNSVYVDYSTAGSAKVGINTGTPGYTLDVNGDVNVTGDIYISGVWFDINSPQTGQGIVYDGTKFVNTSLYEFTNNTYRSSFINNTGASGTSAIEILKRQTSLADGQQAGALMGQIVGTTEKYSHRLLSEYNSSSNSIFSVQIDPTGNFGPTSTTIENILVASNSTLSASSPQFVMNANVTGAPSADASIIANRGSSADVSIKWNETTDRWQDTTDGVTFYNLPNQNLDTTSDVDFSSVTIDNVMGFNSSQTTTTGTSATSISASTKVTQKCVISITDNVTGEMHVLEALAFRKGATAYLTTYGEMYSASSLATFTADVSGGFTRILATPASANSTTFTVARVGVD